MARFLWILGLASIVAACAPPPSEDGLTQLQRSVQRGAAGVNYPLSDAQVMAATNSDLVRAQSILNGSSGERGDSAGTKRNKLKAVFE